MRNQLTAIKPRTASENGFSLIEVMIAIAILSIGVLTVIGMQISVISGNSGARKISDVLVLAEDQMENFMSMPYDDADLDPASNPHRVDTGGYSMVWNVAMSDMDGDGADDSKRVQLTASHLGDAERSTTVQCIIPEP